MNTALERLASEIGLASPEQAALRLAFAQACVSRVRHLLEDPAVVACLDVLERHVQGTADAAALQRAAADAARLANGHRGSASIDGCGHAAVSASYAVAKALEGRAIEAADYAAYATVYAQGGSAAVADRDAFEPEQAWQRAQLQRLAQAAALTPLDR